MSAHLVIAILRTFLTELRPLFFTAAPQGIEIEAPGEKAYSHTVCQGR